MGPNLTKLFEESTREPLLRAPDSATVYAVNDDGYNRISFHVQADARNVPISECRMTARKLALLWNHGEALIAALDEFNTWYGMKGWDARELELTDRISKLLAQLEAEAQP